MKMLKYLGCFILLISAADANAQVRLGIKTGANVASVKFSQNVVEPTNITGFQVGPVVELAEPIFGFAVDVALLYVQKGYKLDGENVKNGFIELPVNLKWKLQLPLVQPFIAAGPYAGYRITGKNVAEVAQYTVATKTINAGLNFAAGVEVLHFLQAGINYAWELTDNYSTFHPADPREYFGKGHSWTLALTVLF